MVMCLHEAQCLVKCRLTRHWTKSSMCAVCAQCLVIRRLTRRHIEQKVALSSPASLFFFCLLYLHSNMRSQIFYTDL